MTLQSFDFERTSCHECCWLYNLLFLSVRHVMNVVDFTIFCFWAYVMNVVDFTIFCFWAYVMNVVNFTIFCFWALRHECFWLYNLLILSVRHECCWLYNLLILSVTSWMLLTLQSFDLERYVMNVVDFTIPWSLTFLTWCRT